MRSSPTIKEVAAHASVSTATVSNVLAGKASLYSQETAKAVLHSVRVLGYRPNRVAQSLKRRCSETLGVVIDKPHGRLTANYYMVALLDGFLEHAAQSGYQIKLISLFMDNSPAALGHLDDGSVDGFAVFAPPDDSPLLSWAAGVRVPVVMAGSVPPAHSFPAVDFDDEGGAWMVVKHLASLGHKRIGLLAGPDAQWSARRRVQGYLRAVREAGIEPAAEWITGCGYAAHTAENAVQALLQVRPRLTAIACWNYEVAAGAIAACHRAGIRVPEELSITGIDDVNPAHTGPPTVTTVRQPIWEIGNTASEMLIRQIQTGERADSVLYSGSLIIGSSTLHPGGDEYR